MFYEYNFDRLQNMGNLKARFNVVIDDCFKISGCEILESSKGNLYIKMPSVPNEMGTGYINVDDKMKDKFFNEVLNDFSLDQKKVIHKIPETLRYTVNLHYFGTSNLKAFCSLKIGSFDISGIRILENKEHNVFVSMPGFKTDKINDAGKPIYDYVANPVTKEFYKELNKSILSVYDEVCLKNEPDEIALLKKTIEEYNDMIDEINNVYIPECINQLNNIELSDVTFAYVEIGDYTVRASKMQNAINVAQNRIFELENQMRSKGVIDSSFSQYDGLFKDIGEAGIGLAPTQKELFYKNLEEINKKTK